MPEILHKFMMKKIFIQCERYSLSLDSMSLVRASKISKNVEMCYNFNGIINTIQ